MISHRPSPPFVMLLLLALAPASSAAPPAAKSSSVKEAPFLRANDVAMTRMMAGMGVAPSGDVDRDFARMMIPHHQGGIDMARALLRYGKDPKMKALARAIIAKQEEEIALMRRMIGERAGARPARMPVMSMPAGANHQAMMP